MLWRKLLVFIGLAVPAAAAIWPAGFQDYRRVGDAAPWQAPERPEVWKEYGLLEAEQATYQASAKPFRVTAWKFQDATGAIAAWQWLLPASAKPSRGLPYAATFDDGTRRGSVAALGNYVIQFEGLRPSTAELKLVFEELPGFRQPPAPTLPQYIPKAADFASSRYILGQQSLAAFLPGWTPQRAGLDLGTEIQLAAKGNLRVALIRYPTPQLARAKQPEFEADPNLAVRRSGPLLGVVFAQDASKPEDRAAAALLSSVDFQATVIENEANPNRPIKDAANLVLANLALAGGLILLALSAGLVYGFLRVRRSGRPGDPDAFQTLHLSDSAPSAK